MSSLLYLSDAYLLGMAVWLLAGAASLFALLKLRRRRRPGGRRLRLVNASLSAWLLLAVLTLLELSFALFYDTTDSFNMTNASQKWQRMHVEPQQRTLTFPGGKGISYRDTRPFTKTVEPGQHRICFVGDSFTFGHGLPNVEDRFSNRVADRLDQTHPGEFVVGNLATAGRDLRWNELLIQRLFDNGYQIDTVVYVLCLNDVETYHPGFMEFYEDLSRQQPRFFLFRHSYFFNFLYFRLRLFTMPEVRDYYSFVKDFYAGRPWERMRNSLEHVQELCKTQGADFRVVVFPFLHNLGPDYEFHSAHQKIVQSCREMGIKVLDLEPVLAPHASEGLVVNPFDAHPNQRANQLAADAIRERLLDDLAE